MAYIQRTLTFETPVEGGNFAAQQQREVGGNSSFEDKPTLLYITDTITQESEMIQFVPEWLEYDPKVELAAIQPIGRNVPIYHYTGAEDTLDFEIDWCSVKLHRQDVIRKCRWLESLSKNDGYSEGIHPVILTWGESNLFANTKWIISAAPYKLGMFHKGYGMLPTQAYQKLSLKKIAATNPTRKQIASYPTMTFNPNLNEFL